MTVSAPFVPGQRVILAHQPGFPAVTVTSCREHPLGGWYVEAELPGGGWESGPAEHYLAVPDDWQDAPRYPTSPMAALEARCVHSWRDPDERRAAEARQRSAEWARERLDHERRYLDWVLAHVVPLDPERYADILAAARNAVWVARRAVEELTPILEVA